MTPTAMETNNNIDRLLAMLDHPERYSEQEIMDTVKQGLGTIRANASSNAKT